MDAYKVLAIVLLTTVTVCFIIYFYDILILIVGSHYCLNILYVSMKIFNMGKF